MVLDITMADAPTPQMWKAIADPLVAFNVGHTGRADAVPRALVLPLRDPATDEIVGGLYGHTVHSYLLVDLLFVPEAMRRSGIGRALLGRAEAEAMRRGCHAASLDTYSFQARGFYERLGYRVFGMLEDFPPGHSRFFLTKRLHAP